mmetsp:Transcript_39093/g.82036  ORF Transcript_39093/g.82036 Transcript_39093/m.82036 type:complete len:154 (+) Transcript_39093:838-1299(+)|eukprot:252489-Pleurochrysis_carterae.AAC.3
MTRDGAGPAETGLQSSARPAAATAMARARRTRRLRDEGKARAVTGARAIPAAALARVAQARQMSQRQACAAVARLCGLAVVPVFPLPMSRRGALRKGAAALHSQLARRLSFTAAKASRCGSSRKLLASRRTSVLIADDARPSAFIADDVLRLS